MSSVTSFFLVSGIYNSIGQSHSIQEHKYPRSYDGNRFQK
nr:MAG TPA: hypothetical protein [Bacteriophage sp.]